MLRGIEKKGIFDDDLDREGFVTGRQVQEIFGTSCKKEGISIQELRRGSRRGPIPRVRSYLAWKLGRELGVPFAEIGRQLGVSTSAISQILERRKMR